MQQKNSALASLFRKEHAFYVDNVLYTGKFCPNHESEGIKAALAWAQELAQMPTEALLKLAAEHLEKSGSTNPGRFEPSTHVDARENEFERAMHHILAKTIRAFVKYRERRHKK